MGVGTMARLGIIGGTGWLGGALVRPALADGVIRAGDLWLSSRKGHATGFEAWPDIHMTTDNAALVATCDIVMLSVRPENLGALSLALSDKLVISVMARVPSAAIAAQFGAARIIRAMPNACAEQRLGFSPLLYSPAVTAEDRAFAEGFFSSSGKVAVVETEALIDYYTALTGSGPAFIAAFANVMITDAIANGLDPLAADIAVRQLFLGASTLMAQSDETPAAIVQTFVDYGGTTTAGLRAMIDTDVATPISNGLAAARDKAAGIIPG